MSTAAIGGWTVVVIACIDFYNPEVQNLIQSDLPVITIDHVFDNRSAVLSDNVNGMEELVEYICSMGHERVAIFMAQILRYRGTASAVFTGRWQSGGSMYRMPVSVRHSIVIRRRHGD